MSKKERKKEATEMAKDKKWRSDQREAEREKQVWRRKGLVERQALASCWFQETLVSVLGSPSPEKGSAVLKKQEVSTASNSRKEPNVGKTDPEGQCYRKGTNEDSLESQRISVPSPALPVTTVKVTET